MPDKSREDYDRLFKICDVYDLITSIFSTAYIPGRDKGMVRWFGCGFRTYLPRKRAKYGKTAYKLCDDSGYTYRFQLYTGQSSNLQCLLLDITEGLLNDG